MRRHGVPHIAGERLGAEVVGRTERALAWVRVRNRVRLLAKG